MRKYSFAATDHRNTINLTDYRDLIIETIHNICPNIEVRVEEDGYYLPEDVPRGDKIKIGRALAQTKLGTYCVNRPLLFIGKNVEEQKNNKKHRNIRKY